MKTTGIVLLILGVLSTLGSFSMVAQGRPTNFAGLSFVVLGAYLMHRAARKKEEQEQKERWSKPKSE